MKKFIIIALILFLILTAGIIYLNKVIFPVKIKALIVSILKKQTGKDVTLKSAEFSVFKGLVLSDLVISDNQNVILSVRQANCTWRWRQRGAAGDYPDAVAAFEKSAR